MREIEIMLETYADLRAQIDVMGLAYEEQRRALIPVELQRELDDLATEYHGQSIAAEVKAKQLAEQIKTGVLAHGATVKGAGYQAVFMKGRTSWDDRALDGYAAAHPEILAFREQGSPSVSLRPVNDYLR